MTKGAVESVLVGMSYELRPSAGLEAARAIAGVLVERGFQAFFAGGCVRDVLLGVAPKDYDVTTSATPDEVMALFPRTLAVGAHFGVVLVVRGEGEERVDTEVATFRHDGVYLDGRRPDAVRFSRSPEEDVLRRDFTINGMLLDPSLIRPTQDGGAGMTGAQTLRVGDEAVLDFVGGREDLRRGLVRTIGEAEQRFTEDKLRMLRGVRFAARLGFALEAATLEAMQRLAGTIHEVSNERIRDELTRMLTEGHARRAFELLDQAGLLANVLPEISRMHGVEQPPEYHPEGDVWVHTLMLLDHLPAGAAPTLAWGMLLHDVGKPATYQPPQHAGDRIRFNGHAEVGTRMAEEICRRLRFSVEDEEQIAALVKNHMRFGDVRQMRESTLKRFMRMPRFGEHMALHFADVSSSHGDLRLYGFVRERLEASPAEALRPMLLVTGRELIRAGYRPGVAFKGMLEAAEDAQLEGRIATTEEGLALVREVFGEA